MTDKETTKMAEDVSLILEFGTPEEKQGMGKLVRESLPEEYKDILNGFGIVLDDEI